MKAIITIVCFAAAQPAFGAIGLLSWGHSGLALEGYPEDYFHVGPDPMGSAVGWVVLNPPNAHRARGLDDATRGERGSFVLARFFVSLHLSAGAGRAGRPRRRRRGR